MNTTQQDYGQDYNTHHGPLPEGNKNGLQWPRLPPPESPPLTCGSSPERSRSMDFGVRECKT